MKSIYKSEEGRRVMEEWYERFLGRLAARGTPADEIRVETRHGDTNVLVAGPEDAPPIVCFHGAMSSAAAALVHIPALLDHFRVYFPDTIGQPGRSDHRKLNWQGEEHGWWAIDVIDGLGMDKVHTLGVSLGGYVSLRLASLAPDRVERAVLWAPGGLVKPAIAPMFGLIWDGLAYNISPSRKRLEKVLRRTFTDLDDDYVAFFADTLKHVHPDRRFPAILPDGALQDWTGEVLLVVNEHDDVFPADRIMRRAEREIPHVVDTVMMDGCAHMPPFADGALDELMQTVSAFVGSERPPKEVAVKSAIP